MKDIFAVRRRFFTQFYNKAIEDFANTEFVNKDKLHSSFVQYETSTESIANISRITNNKQFDKYKAVYPKAIPLKYGLEMKRQ
jgi:type I restriction enzyme, R subunit